LGDISVTHFIQMYTSVVLVRVKSAVHSPLLFHGTCRASGYMFVTTHVLAQHLLMHLWSQDTVDIYHAALSSLLRPFRLRPRVIPSFPSVSLVSPCNTNATRPAWRHPSNATAFIYANFFIKPYSASFSSTRRAGPEPRCRWAVHYQIHSLRQPPGRR
jgi:hypothetical protein